MQNYNTLTYRKEVITIKREKLLLALSLILITFLFTGCLPFSSPPTVEEALLASIKASPSEMTLEIGESKTITSVTAHYDNGAEAAIALTACTYESDNLTYVTVLNGIITVLGSCTGANAIITVSYTEDDVTKSDNVTVTVPSSGG